jgi:hypothetical protein
MTLAQAFKKQFGEVSYPFDIYDSNGSMTYHEDNNGYWVKKEYNSKGNITYYKSSNGYWSKREYNSKGNRTYYEDSDGYWVKSEYNSKGKETYFAYSNGYKSGVSRSSCNGKVVEIDGKKYELKELA